MNIPDVLQRDVPRETIERLNFYVRLLKEEIPKQNLISAATVSEIWNRHIIDCAQLLRHAPDGCWVDVGSGAGLPGIVLAVLSGNPVVLIEPRRLRADFLRATIHELGLSNATVFAGKAALVSATFDMITARAVASASGFFALAHHLARPDTVWVLPKGRSAQKELDEARGTWQGEFRLEPSLTDAHASVLVATRVRRRAS